VITLLLVPSLYLIVEDIRQFISPKLSVSKSDSAIKK
jgi:hypothetical protein